MDVASHYFPTILVWPASVGPYPPLYQRHVLDSTVTSPPALSRIRRLKADPRARESARSFGIDLTGHLHAVTRAGRAPGYRRRGRHGGPTTSSRSSGGFPDCAGKAYLLGCLAPDGRLEIDDPLNAPIDVLEDCFRRIDAAVGRVAELVLQGASASTD